MQTLRIGSILVFSCPSFKDVWDVNTRAKRTTEILQTFPTPGTDFHIGAFFGLHTGQAAPAKQCWGIDKLLPSFGNGK